MGRETEAQRPESEEAHNEIPGEETRSNETDTAVTGFLKADRPTEAGSMAPLKEDTGKRTCPLHL